MGILLPFPSPKSISLYDAGGTTKSQPVNPAGYPTRCKEDRRERNLRIGNVEGKVRKDKMVRKHCRRGLDKEGDS